MTSREVAAERRSQALAEVCPNCGAHADTWCVTRNQTESKQLHQDRYAVAEHRAEVTRRAAHAAQLAAISDPEQMKP